MIWLMFELVVLNCVAAVPSGAQEENKGEINNLKYATKYLAVQLEKWNNLFLTSLEPRISASASMLSSIDSNINNLQERAHVWDTFQLHVSAWNDQLATLDRKIDIIGKGQEKMMSIESKLNSIINMEYKIDNVIKKLDDIQNDLKNLNQTAQTNEGHLSHDMLFGEFAARGILSTVKLVEKKLDRLLLSQNTILKTSGNEEKSKLTIKCNTPKVTEELLHDMSSKIDVMFDKIAINEGDEYDAEEGSGDVMEMVLERNQPEPKLLKREMKRTGRSCVKTGQIMEELLDISLRIENSTKIILDNSKVSFEQVFSWLQNNSKLVTNKIHNSSEELNQSLGNVLESYFEEMRTHFESSCKRQQISRKSVTTSSNQTINDDTSNMYLELNKTLCEDLESSQPSGVYFFNHGTNYTKKYCEIRYDGLWTVIQRRNNYDVLQNFGLTWYAYKTGFGSLSTDFWIGNEAISELSMKKDLVLRIELEDFEGNKAWAEYATFKVLPESQSYQLVVGGYTGNASDSFSSHNSSKFSTFDRTNDEAPACCPCAVSYGSGWWFNSCFESNLNGVYHRTPNDNGHFRGIIWEHWLGNYSLKKSVMMTKPKGKVYSASPPRPRYESGSEDSTIVYPYYEDP